MKLTNNMMAAAGVGAGLAAWSLLNRRRRGADLRGNVVLITGGSRGLGLALAREFASQGCHLAICARDSGELNRARADLQSRGARVQTIQCDVADRDQVENMVRQVGDEYGRIDVLVNNAGIIQVGPIETMGIEEFERAMGVIFWGTLYTTLAALPQMQARKSGRIVNITSIGGKVSVPHLIPYSCAKFATVALSEGLRAELAHAGIQVVTIVPGLMRTGSHLNASFHGNATGEFTWFGLGAAAPGVSIGAERAARSIVRSTARGSAISILSAPANMLARLHGVLPEFTVPIMSMVNHFLLPDAGDSTPISGKQAQEKLNSRIFEAATTLGRSAAGRLNEMPARS